MRRPLRRSFLGSILLFLFAMDAISAEAPNQPYADRPYATVFASSITKLRAACDVVFESVERLDLSESLSERLNRYNEFAGIDVGKPLGMMFMWGNIADSQIVFLPVMEINDLLETATFDVVDFHKVGPEQYEIERPGKPYHVLVRNEYAFFGESLEKIRAIRATPEQLTRRLRDQYDIAVKFDFLQIPKSTKKEIITVLRKEVVPCLQPHDDEADESANLRRCLGEMALELIERLVLETRTLMFGIRLDQKMRCLSIEVIIDAAPESRLATAMNQLIARRSQFSPFTESDTPVEFSDTAAGLIVNFKINSLVDRMFRTTRELLPKPSQLEVGIQLAGNGIGDLSLITAFNGSDAEMLNENLPKLLMKLEKAGQIEQLYESFDVHHGVVLHSFIPSTLPKMITDWIGTDIEMIAGQGKGTVWLSAGSPEKILDHLQESISLIDEATSNRIVAPAVRAQIRASKLPGLVVSNVLIPNVNRELVQDVFSQGDDGFSLKVDGIEDGLKVRFDFDEGFTRLIGRDWILQIDGGNRQ